MKLLNITLLAGLVSASSAQEFCANIDERSQECGATNPSRPAVCCEGLVCASAGGGSPTCVAPFPTASPTNPVFTCAALGEKSQACGAVDLSRPLGCCDGLVCSGGASVRCVEPVPTAAPLQCAPLDDRAKECGAIADSRPDTCCGDLVCAPGASQKCVEPFPTASPTAFVEDCAPLGERALDCGATNPKRSQSCCEGTICSPKLSGGTAFSCIEDPNTSAPNPPPTPAPTASPTISKPATAPTEKPTFTDTLAPSPEPTFVFPDAQSSASSCWGSLLLLALAAIAPHVL